MKRILICSFFSLLALGTQAEVLHMNGKVIDQDGKPIAGAIVTYVADEMPMWSFPEEPCRSSAVTDENGCWEFDISSHCGADVFEVQAKGYTLFLASRSCENFPLTDVIVTLYNTLIYKANERTTIVLPVKPDPTLGKYYYLDHEDGNQLVFEREWDPQAETPYVFIPYRDIRINISAFAGTVETGQYSYHDKSTEHALMYGHYVSRCEPKEDISLNPGYITPAIFPLEVLAASHGIADVLPKMRPMHALLEYKASAFTKKDLLTGEMREVVPELVFHDPEDDYRPFIEEGKVWKVGKFNLAWDLWAIESHYFEGDTIVGGYPCKKMIEAYDVLFTGDHTESYQGAIYEDGRRVYCAWPNNDNFFLLYDFASTEGSDISFCDYEWRDPYDGQIQSKIFRQDDKFHGWTTSFAEVFMYEEEYPIPVNFEWMEGVGYQGFYNFVKTDKAGYYRELLSCTVGDEVLYYDAALWNDDNEVKKNTIDFTHTVKTQPKAPRRGESEDEETLTGEYSLKELFVNFKPLAGPYVITICDESGTEVYRKEVQTSNVIGLNTDISGYAKGEYTITVENDTEAYSAKFCIDDVVGINRPTPDPSRNGGEKADAWYDLSGRKVINHQLPRGVYIRDGRKVVVR